MVASLQLCNGSLVLHPDDQRSTIVLARDPATPSKLEPTKEYKDHLRKVYADRNKKVVVHQDKLEQKIVHLKEQVKSLSKQMSKEEALTAIYRAESRALTQEEQEHKGHDLSVEGEGDLKSKRMADSVSAYEEPTVMEERIGRVASVIMFGLMLLGAVSFFLLMYGDPKLTLSVWQTIENVASIFIAVMWFQAFDDLLEAGGWAAHHEVLAALLHAMFLFSVCVVLSWTIKDKHRYLTALTAVGAHYISFSALHAGMSDPFGLQPALCSNFLAKCSDCVAFAEAFSDRAFVILRRKEGISGTCK